MSSIPTTALAGLNAATTRMNVSASNTVNQLSTGTPGENNAYKAKDVVQSSTGFGPNTHIKERDPATITGYAPNHAGADKKGYVEFPNVDVATELVNQNQARRSYEASLKVLKAWDEMQDSVIDIKS